MRLRIFSSSRWLFLGTFIKEIAWIKLLYVSLLCTGYMMTSIGYQGIHKMCCHSGTWKNSSTYPWLACNHAFQRHIIWTACFSRSLSLTHCLHWYYSVIYISALLSISFQAVHSVTHSAVSSICRLNWIQLCHQPTGLSERSRCKAKRDLVCDNTIIKVKTKR